MWNCGNDDVEFVNIVEFVCEFDCYCECPVEDVLVCVLVHEMCVCLSASVCVCACYARLVMYSLCLFQ